MVSRSSISASWIDPCSCSLVQMGCGATLTLDLSWFTDLQAKLLLLGVRNATGCHPIALQRSPQN